MSMFSTLLLAVSAVVIIFAMIAAVMCCGIAAMYIRVWLSKHLNDRHQAPTQNTTSTTNTTLAQRNMA